MSLTTSIERPGPRTSTDPVTVLHARVVTGAGGGPDKTILRSPRYLRDQGYNELCLFLRPPGDSQFAVLERRALEADAELLAVDDRGPLDWRVIGSLVKVCRERQVTIWHGHDYKSNALGLIVNRYWPMRLVTTVHGWVQNTWKTPLYYLIDRHCLRSYERVIAVSTDLHATCLRWGVKPDRCQLLENGIELDAFTRRNSPATAKQRLGLDPARPLVGAIGRLSAEKGFLDLIGVVETLVRAGRDLQLVILGDGPQRGELERTIVERQLDRHVRLLGHRNDVSQWLEAMDLFVLSSLREGLPNVLLEAMALETPVVATEVGGVARLVRHNTNGLLVPPASLDALARDISARARLLTIWENRDLRELIRSADPVRLSFLTALLADAGIDSLILDTHSSVMQGSLGILPQRLMVANDDLAQAQAVLIEAEELDPDPQRR